MKITNLMVEYISEPLGIDVKTPRFYWKVDGQEQKNIMQEAYNIKASADKNYNDIIWDTGRVDSSDSIHIPWNGTVIESKTTIYWQVKVWDNQGNESDWICSKFESGLIDDEWPADWITPSTGGDLVEESPSPILRKEFTVDKAVTKARLYITALGLYQAEINGKRVGDMELTPGWTSYQNWVQYQTYDITDSITNGDNAIAVTLGNGWYRGPLLWDLKWNIHGGDRVALLSFIEITYDDGSTQQICTDSSWKGGFGPIQASEIYHGEVYDAGKESNYAHIGFEDKEFTPVVKLEKKPSCKIIGQKSPAMRKVDEVKPIELITTPNGDTVIDFGQNLVGWIKLNVTGNAGDEVFVKHGEVMLDNEFYNGNYRKARAEFKYILKGGNEEIYEPKFTFYGFRYIKVEKFPGTPSLDNFTGVVVTSDMPYGGCFETSHQNLNKLFQNIIWGQKGNFVDIPTDCPQRDERLGWTGDTQVFTATACYNSTAPNFYEKWLVDLAYDQREDGAVPNVIPDALKNGTSSAWGDAATIVPMAMWDFYADKVIIKNQYDSMKKWVEYIRKQGTSEYLWDDGFHFGDWLAMDGYGAREVFGGTPKEIVATSMFYKSTMNLVKAAEILEYEDDVKEYSELAENVKKAFNDEFITSGGRISGETQTAYTLALDLGLIADKHRKKAVDKLVELIKGQRYGITTGFVGTPYITKVLAENGHADVAYNMILNDQCPSWIYPITMGATTIWERWDSLMPDGKLNPNSMNSFNHYAYGAVAEWMYRNILGINPCKPAFKEFVIKPLPVNHFTYAKGGTETLYGRINSAWKYENNIFTFEFTIPANTTAKVLLPWAAEGDVEVSCDYKVDDDGIWLSLGSGDYCYKWTNDTVVKNMKPEGMSMSTLIRKLVQSEAAMAVLKKYMPKAMNDDSNMSQAMNMSLNEIKSFVPSSVVSEEDWVSIAKELAEIEE